jgi:hypothetical protein
MKKTLLFVSFIIASLFMSKQVSAQIIFLVTDPASVAGTYEFTYVSGTDWGISLDTVFVQAPLALVNDGTAADSLGCDPLINGAQIAGKIAVVYRGACEFGQKALNAQNAGAVGVIIINNAAGPPVGMGGGTFGTQVIIPTIMIGQATGATLRAHIDNGTAIAMIGNKTGVFADDLGAFKQHIVLPNSWAIPSGIATNAAAFEIPLGAWVFNYGQNAQPATTLNATITLGSNVLYNQTSSAISLSQGDSAFISLPVFSQPSYADGLYELEYTISGGAGDDFPGDNVLLTHFWIQPHHYTKASWNTDVTPMLPNNSSHYRTVAASGPDFQWCIILQHPDAGNLMAHGMAFSASTAAGGDLTGVTIELNLYEWNDVIIDSMTFNSLNLIGNTFYDYLDNTNQRIYVEEMFPSPIQLSNNQKYLACVHTFIDGIFIGADDALDYETSWDAYNQSATQFDDLSVFFPIRSGTDPNYTWNGVGFGSNPVPAIVLHTSPQGLVGVNENAAASVILPYPNPASELITIPLRETYNGKVIVQVYDIAGRNVKSEVVNMNNTNNFIFNTTNLTNGIYHFNLKFGDDSVSSFPVVITR